jgi:hypothetical protein
MRPVTSSGSPSHNQHLNLRPVTELPRLQLVCARAKGGPRFPASKLLRCSTQQFRDLFSILVARNDEKA